MALGLAYNESDEEGGQKEICLFLDFYLACLCGGVDVFLHLRSHLVWEAFF